MCSGHKALELNLPRGEISRNLDDDVTAHYKPYHYRGYVLSRDIISKPAAKITHGYNKSPFEFILLVSFLNVKCRCRQSIKEMISALLKFVRFGFCSRRSLFLSQVFSHQCCIVLCLLSQLKEINPKEQISKSLNHPHVLSKLTAKWPYKKNLLDKLQKDEGECNS